MKVVIALLGFVGVLLPVAVLTVDRLSRHGWWPRWVYYVWPTSYMLLANEAIMNARAYAVIIVSVILNALIYSLVALALGWAIQSIRRFKR